MVIKRKLRILQVNSSDGRGGAAKVAVDLHRAYQRRGHDGVLLVGNQKTEGSNIFTLANERYAKNHWSRFWWRIYSILLPYYSRYRGVPYRINQLLHGLAEKGSLLDDWRGIENFNYPASWYIASESKQIPDVLHFHNLHRNYFDLRALPTLSRRFPTFITLHDMWLLTGHCAHAFECKRWQSGCGDCPDLSIYPAIRQDATAENWKRKQNIFTQSKLYVISPSRWLMEKVERSILWPGIVDAKVIPHGVDQNTFRPADKGETRARLGLPARQPIFLIAANGIKRSPWKDYRTLRGAISQVAERVGEQQVLLLALGDDGPNEKVGSVTIRFIPYEHDPNAVARYYQAADVYLHVSRAEVFPLTILEALSCGTPVVATAVGGIPEAVNSLDAKHFTVNDATGILTAPGDTEALADAMILILKESSISHQLAQNAERDAAKRFDFRRQVGDYLDWYADVLAQETGIGTNIHG